MGMTRFKDGVMVWLMDGFVDDDDLEELKHIMSTFGIYTGLFDVELYGEYTGSETWLYFNPKGKALAKSRLRSMMLQKEKGEDIEMSAPQDCLLDFIAHKRINLEGE